MPTQQRAAVARGRGRAARAGAATTVVTAWLLLFVLAPYLAAHAHVGHHHPADAPEHVHALQTVLPSLPAAERPPCADVALAPEAPPGFASGLLARDGEHRLPCTRAPPLATV